MHPLLNYPFDPYVILRKKKSIRRELLEEKNLTVKKIAILGGSTTAEIKDILELFLMDQGIQPLFFESEYGKYYEDVMFGNPELVAFKPDIAYFHTTSMNISRFPTPGDTGEQVAALLRAEMDKFTGLWNKAEGEFQCAIIQNNFEMPHYRLLGNLDAVETSGKIRFIEALNREFAEYARLNHHFYLLDLHYLSAWFGLHQWHERQFWHLYKYALNYAAIPYLAQNVAAIIRAIYGKSKKCLVLDLDNTLWGGVIGDDGLKGIQIGNETADAEAYTEFQKYTRELKQRGIILSVCSKNEMENAKEGFSHPDSVLKLEDFAAFKANWDPKPGNIQAIAHAISLGLDSFVFADDNPVEREIVKQTTPDVAVPEIGSNPSRFVEILDRSGFFETVALSADDLKRAEYYRANAARDLVQGEFKDYDEFLKSLEMEAEIRPFDAVYLDRIAQLTNKTNQFNLTTRRYTQTEMEQAMADPNCLTLYGRLKDKFGDNGLISVVLGHIEDGTLHLDLWLMSCRVLKRGMENAMLDAVIQAARARGLKELRGYYCKTAKNKMVQDFYDKFGFALVEEKDNGNKAYRLELPKEHAPRNQFIKVTA